jgi:hypothetical protein
MEIDESLSSEIVRRMLAVSKPDRIILFGSAAGGCELSVVSDSRSMFSSSERSVSKRRRTRSAALPTLPTSTAV